MCLLPASPGVVGGGDTIVYSTFYLYIELCCYFKGFFISGKKK